MVLVNVIAIFSAIFGLLYTMKINTNGRNDDNNDTLRMWYDVIFACILSVAFLIRVIGAVKYLGYESDMNCFFGWADRIYKVGFGEFYSKDVFTDYPPGYMYVLYVLGAIRNLLNLDYYSGFYVFLVKLPAILCDLFAGGLIYHMAKKHFTGKSAVIISCFYLLNPAIIINSSIWGQVDSVYTLFVILMCYFVYQKKLPYAYFAFGLGILIKPQMLIFSPILLYGIIDQVFLEDFTKKKFVVNLAIGLSAIGVIALLAMPFGLSDVIGQYTDTITSYPYASINAYNIWTVFGLNWVDQTGKFLFLTYNQWGTLFIILVIAIATYISFKLKNNKSKYFYLAGFIITGIFTLSVRMHERYMFPALILLLLTYVIRPRKEILYLYISLSIIHLYNVAHVLFKFDPLNFSSKAMVPIMIGIATVLAFGYLLYYTLVIYIKDNDCYVDSGHGDRKVKGVINTTFRASKILKKDDKNPIKKSVSKIPLKKADYIIILIITIIYSAIALYDLGDHKIPETSWESNITNDSVIVDLGDVKKISEIAYYLGNYENRIVDIEVSDTYEGPYTNMSEFEMAAVFRWGTQEYSASGRYVKITSKSDRISLRELMLFDADGNILMPINLDNVMVANLFDEQDLYPGRSTFRDSTYFDEIYHARTAYEYIHGLYSYENTHPPLGKIFIALGMLIFGVNPFGWRIMGTLFGIAMVPIIYIFAKKLLKETWLASVVCILFTFDFMHFTQTRIATIDVFVTLFIMLMYYYMYQYIRLSFYDTKLSKTLIPLGLSGLCMGLGIASKWTGVYAGAGLAIIFFLHLYQRYREYQYALKHQEGYTNGIEHKEIVANFYSNMWKTILFCIGAFVVVPIIIYILSYLPFQDGSDAGVIARMLKNQETMFSYHSHVDATHPYSSWWYQWPIMYRPIWYYSGHISDTISEGISAFGNPLVWWVGIPAFLYMIYLAIKNKDKIARFLIISYLAQYVPWFLVTRITFIYHYFPSVAFVTLMIGYSIKNIVEKYPKLKKATFVYAGLVIILFMMFYPVLSGHAVSKDFVSQWLRWFDSWVLVS